MSLPMLGWLAAAAAPLLIHLWSRRKYRETPWAAMEYLLAAVRQQSRRIQFEQWLLLAVRTLLVLLVVLAVAEPYFEQTGFAMNVGGRVHRVLVLDGSFSMAYRPTEKTRFDRAKEAARQIVLESSPGDVFTLVLMASSPQVIVGTAALPPSAVVEEIDRLRQPQTTADLPATVVAVRRLVEKVARDNPQIARHDVVFFTDLQRVTWSPKLTDTAKAEFRRTAKELSQDANLLVIDLGQPTAENLAITDLQAADPLVTVDYDVQFRASLKNFGRHAPHRQIVEWFVDGRRMAQLPAEFSTDGSAEVAFTHRFDAPGDHSIEARAMGDQLEVDNHRYLAVPVRPAVRVLCIDGRPSGLGVGGAADYLAVALNVPDEASGHARVKADVATENAILERGLSAYDCVFFCNVAQYIGSEARAIDGYLQGGGSVVFFLGDRVLADRYNSALGVADEQPKEKRAGQGRAGRPAILPARLGRLIEEPQFRLDPLGFRHPIAQAFRGRGETSLLTTPVFKHFQLIPAKDSQATTVVALGNGDPLLIERSVRRGRVLLMATSAEPAWTALPLWPSFVPLVQEIVARCAAGQVEQRNITAGEPIEMLQPGSFDSKPSSVQTPDGGHGVMQMGPADGGSYASFGDTLQSGFYTVKPQAPASRGQMFAVNVDTSESDLTQLSPNELRDDVWPGVPLVYRAAWQDAAAAAVGLSHGKNQFHVDLLYGALGLLFFETLLAWKMDGGGDE
jgi:hypothetical protein